MRINENDESDDMQWFNIENSSETLAFFGAARLIRLTDGRHDVVGGTVEERSRARKWCSLCAPEVVLKDGFRHEMDFPG